jgi:hypothetical protein
MRQPSGPILILLLVLCLPIPLTAGTEPSGSAADSLAGRLAGIDKLLQMGEWRLAEESARHEIERLRPSLSAGVLAAGLARLALAEAGLGRKEEAVWHWQVAQALDRNTLPEAALRTSGAAGELLSRHPLRPAGQAPPNLEVHSLGGTVEPPHRIEGELPKPSPALRALSVPLWIRAQLVIDTEGRPREPVILGTSLPGMAFEVLEAVRGWRFEPARKEGRPVAVFYQISLNPLAEKPLSEIAHFDLRGSAEVDGLLRAGQWKEADRRARKLWETGLSKFLKWEEMGFFLALRALAEAGLGQQDEAICHWQAAQHLDPSLYQADLAAYGAAGDLLDANRWGTVLDDSDPIARREPPSLVKSTRVTLRVRAPVSERFLMAGMIDTKGRVRQPVLWSAQELTPFQGPAVPHDMLTVRESPLERMVAMSALESICSWQFEPTRIDHQPLTAASVWTVGVDNTRGRFSGAGRPGFPPVGQGQGPFSPAVPKSPGPPPP